MEAVCEAGTRLGLSYINIAHHGQKRHLARMVTDTLALVLFDRPKTRGTMVALWDIEAGQARTSTDLNFPLGMLWDWDWRAEAVAAAFENLVPSRTPEDAPMSKP